MSVGCLTVWSVYVENPDRQASRLVATAALRAAVAWTRRDTQPEAWRELSRMTGVVSFALGPGRGPAEPLELVQCLRQPLVGILGATGGLERLGELVLLDPDDQLTDAAIEVGCEYTQALFNDVDDPGSRWLPSWAWQRAEQVQRRVFERLVSSGSDEAYRATRRFLIEHPAGDERELVDRMNQLGARHVATYAAIPPDRIWRARSGSWWWPCPGCRWPMRVKGAAVECGYSHHGARFRVNAVTASANQAPSLVKLSSARLQVPDAQAVEKARCVELAVWRFVTVPGMPEIELERRLLRIEGVAVEMWPDMDRVDLLIRTPGGRLWEVDVKDHADPITIVEDAPSARDIVVPDYRPAQVRSLSRSLPEKRVWTISGFIRHVRVHVPRGTE
jgi:hypothetical protein